MLSNALKQLRLDVKTVVSSLMGRPPPPLVARSTRRAPRVYAESRPSVSLGRPLRIDAVVEETSDTVSLVLACPSGKPIDFLPGQFFTLVVPVAGELLRRAYSASSCPGDLAGRVRVTVKRVKDGKVSSRLTSPELTRVGEVLTVLGPSGSFVPSRSTSERYLLLVAGGSGVTPMMAIAKTLLSTETSTKIALLFGNRSESDIPFRVELDALVREHEGRFVVRHVLSAPAADWNGGVGTLTRDVLDRELPALLASDSPLEAAFVCGPEPMMAAAREALVAFGVDTSHISEERFVSPPARQDAPSGPVEVTITANGTSKRTLQTVGQTLLEAGLAAGIDMPYSCAMGGCGACKVHVSSGETTQDGAALTEEERQSGFVLACVDRALGPCAIAVQK